MTDAIERWPDPESQANDVLMGALVQPDPNPTVMVECPRCLVCGERATLEIDLARFEILTGENPPHIQVLFPEMSAEDRELIISGTHPACWDQLMPDDES